jgi:hypothetical protein
MMIFDTVTTFHRPVFLSRAIKSAPICQKFVTFIAQLPKKSPNQTMLVSGNK